MTTLTDNSATYAKFIFTGVDVGSTLDVHVTSILIEKDTDVTRFPLIRLLSEGGTLSESVYICFNTMTGDADIANSGTLPAENIGGGVIDYDATYWRVWLAMKTTVDATTLYTYIYPAYNSVLNASSIDVTLISKSIVATKAMLTKTDDLKPYTATTYTYGYLVLTDVVGSFVDGELLQVIGESDGYGSGFTNGFG